MSTNTRLQEKQISKSANNWIVVNNWIAHASNNKIIRNRNQVSFGQGYGEEVIQRMDGCIFGQINHSHPNTYAFLFTLVTALIFCLPEKAIADSN